MNSQNKPKVFIIDDNDMTRAVLRIIIQGADYTVIGEAAGGKSGLERATRLRPDIICLDVIMPDSDGLELLPQIKEALPQTLVLMVTASNDIETVKTALQRGASGFVIKPFNTKTVLNTLAKTAAMLPAVKESLESPTGNGLPNQ